MCEGIFTVGRGSFWIQKSLKPKKEKFVRSQTFLIALFFFFANDFLKFKYFHILFFFFVHFTWKDEWKLKRHEPELTARKNMVGRIHPLLRKLTVDIILEVNWQFWRKKLMTLFFFFFFYSSIFYYRQIIRYNLPSPQKKLLASALVTTVLYFRYTSICSVTWTVCSPDGLLTVVDCWLLTVDCCWLGEGAQQYGLPLTLVFEQYGASQFVTQYTPWTLGQHGSHRL